MDDDRSISVVVPTLDEADFIGPTLAAIRAGCPREIIVADGGSRDGTPQLALAHGAIVIASEPGRGIQLNAGARHASGAVLLFVHADTRLPEGYPDMIHATLARPKVVVGAFQFSVDDPAWLLRWVERGVNWRSRRRQRPYGDQAFFAGRDTFDRLGGFAEVPILEDVDFIDHARRLGRIGLAAEPIVTSGRRWRRTGVLRTTLVNQCCLLGRRVGVPPARLARWRGRSPAFDPAATYHGPIEESG